MRKCARCGKEFNGGAGERFCKECAVSLIRGDSGKQDLVKNYVRDNQGVSEYDVMEKFGVSKKFVRQMFQNRIFDLHTKGTRYPCAHCGRMITEGVYCKECFVLLRQEVKHQSERLQYLRGMLNKERLTSRSEKIILLVGHGEQKLLKYILDKGMSGYKTAEASNAVSALNVVHNQGVQLILLEDEITNAYDGLAILEKLRSDVEACDLPIIMLTKSSDKSKIAAGIRQGATDYIIMPCEPGELLNRVKKHLGIEIEEVRQPEEREKIDYEIEKTYKILIVESDEDAAARECEILEKNFPVEVEIAPNGIEGLYMLSDPQFEVDLVLVSMKMPFMDGYEFLAFVAEDKNIKRYPTLIMAESENLGSLSGLKNTLAKGYITKPEITEEGLDLIERVLLGEI